MDINVVKLMNEEPETEYVYFCGGIQPIIIPEAEESEEAE